MVQISYPIHLVLNFAYYRHSKLFFTKENVQRVILQC